MIADTVLDIAGKAGTLSMQALLLVGLTVVGLALRKMYNQSIYAQKDFSDRMEAKEAGISQERKERITMLTGLLREDIEVKQRMVTTVEGNTVAIKELEEFMKEQSTTTRELIKETRKR